VSNTPSTVQSSPTWMRITTEMPRSCALKREARCKRILGVARWAQVADGSTDELPSSATRRNKRKTRPVTLPLNQNHTKTSSSATTCRHFPETEPARLANKLATHGSTPGKCWLRLAAFDRAMARQPEDEGARLRRATKRRALKHKSSRKLQER